MTISPAPTSNGPDKFAHAPTSSEFFAAADKHLAQAAKLRRQAESANAMVAQAYRRRAAELELAAFAQELRAQSAGFLEGRSQVAS